MSENPSGQALDYRYCTVQLGGSKFLGFLFCKHQTIFPSSVGKFQPGGRTTFYVLKKDVVKAKNYSSHASNLLYTDYNPCISIRLSRIQTHDYHKVQRRKRKNKKNKKLKIRCSELKVSHARAKNSKAKRFCAVQNTQNSALLLAYTQHTDIDQNFSLAPYARWRPPSLQPIKGKPQLSLCVMRMSSPCRRATIFFCYLP